jgi:hypothetical protein
MTWEPYDITEREFMEAANASIFLNRPDLQFRFDGSAPPLLPAGPQDNAHNTSPIRE